LDHDEVRVHRSKVLNETAKKNGVPDILFGKNPDEEKVITVYKPLQKLCGQIFQAHRPSVYIGTHGIQFVVQVLHQIFLENTQGTLHPGSSQGMKTLAKLIDNAEEIARLLSLSRNTVRTIIAQGGAPPTPQPRADKLPLDEELLRRLYQQCQGHIARVHEKLVEEVREFQQAGTEKEREQEFGDLLFTLVNIARRLGVDPEAALREATSAFASVLPIWKSSAASMAPYWCWTKSRPALGEPVRCSPSSTSASNPTCWRWPRAWPALPMPTSASSGRTGSGQRRRRPTRICPRPSSSDRWGCTGPDPCRQPPRRTCRRPS
jgi:phosphoribosyl-ATP pyrophosphohydrolase